MIRKASRADIDAVVRIYDEVHLAEEKGETTTGWIRGVYPVRSTAAEPFERGELFVLEEDGEVLGAGIINRTQVDVYYGAPWEHEAAGDEVCVLHTLVISPRAGRRGLGKRFVAFYEEYARERGWCELRLDTNERNCAARAMYRSLGYKEISVAHTRFNGIPDINLVLLEKHLK